MDRDVLLVFFADLFDALVNVRVVPSLCSVLCASQWSIIVEVDSAAVHDYLGLLAEVARFSIDGRVSFEAIGGLLGGEGLSPLKVGLRVLESGIEPVGVWLIPRKNAVDVKSWLFVG